MQPTPPAGDPTPATTPPDTPFLQAEATTTWLPEWTVWLAARKYLLYPLLALLAAALYVPGQVEVPPLDRDEPRFAQASKQMVESGDYIHIAFQDQSRLKKPIGIYWLQSGSAALLAASPTDLWTYRLPSLIGAVLAVVLCAAIGAVLFAGPVGAAAGLLFAPVLLLSVEAHLAKTDAVLLAAILAAQWALARVWMAANPDTARGPVQTGTGTAMAFWLAIGAGVLVKGPVILMIAGLTALPLSLWQWRGRWLLALKPLWGVPLALAVIIPWFVAIHFATDGAFWEEALGRDFLSKIGQGQEAHGGPPGLYLGLMFVTFWPAAALLGMAALAAWRGRRAPAVQFCLAWIIPNWIVFELVATKLPHYVLPLYPALALLAGYMLVRAGQAPAKRWVARLVTAPAWIAMAFAALLVPVALIGPFFLGGGIGNGGGIAAAAAFAALAYVLFRFARNAFSAPFPIGIMLLAMLLDYWPAYKQVIPGLSDLWVSSHLAEAFAAHHPGACTGEPVLFTVGYNEPSLVFLAGTGTRAGNATQAAVFLAEDPACHLAAVDQRYWPAFEQALNGTAVNEHAIVTGLNYSKGRQMRIRLVQQTPTH
jgi:4-amino-4-deoxy-L-arabinose transferase-like glycosyltransferase